MLHLALALTLATTYEVGPGQTLANINDVPWESLAAGDTVRIHARPTPYAEKFVVGVVGTAGAPVTVQGVPDAAGNLPVLTGENATTRTQTNFWSEGRGLIKIGGSNSPNNTTATYVVIEGLHLMKARDAYSFTGRNGVTQWDHNAAGIFIEEGVHVTIRGCEIEDSANGLFASYASQDVLVEGNYLHGNGNVGSAYEHNNYTEAQGITFQYNRFGPLCTGCDGNNLKDRSSGTVIRFNWIESGNRQLDLVDSDHTEELSDPAYATTYVYGNVLIEPDGAGNSQIAHFGGDSGTTANYRGALYFWNNTVVSTRSGNTTLLRLSSNGQNAFVFDNLVYASAGSGALGLVDDTGQLWYRGNWLSAGYVDTHNGSLGGTVNDQGQNLTGADPGFVDATGQDFHLTATSPARDTGPALPTDVDLFPLDHQYLKHQQGEPRPQDAALDMGAYEYASVTSSTSGSTSGSTSASSAASSSTGTTGASTSSSASSAASTSGSAGTTGGTSAGSSAGSTTGGASTASSSSASSGSTSGSAGSTSSASSTTGAGSVSSGSTGSTSAGGKARGGCGCTEAPGAEVLLAALALLGQARRLRSR